MNRASRAVILFIAQGAWSGKAPFAPGTAGTLAGVVLFWGIKDVPWPFYAFLCVLISVLGAWTAGRAERLLGCTDCPSIVIDEIAGFLVSLFLIPVDPYTIIAAFCLFRFFDIVKPWPLDDLQKIRGGLGVMADDIGAGVYTNIVLRVGISFLAS